MKLFVDFSLFVMDQISVGRVYGYINLPLLPPTGSYISLKSNNKDHPYPTVKGFFGILKVEKVIIRCFYDDYLASLSLEDMVLTSLEDAKAYIDYLKKALALEVDENLDFE